MVHADTTTGKARDRRAWRESIPGRRNSTRCAGISIQCALHTSHSREPIRDDRRVVTVNEWSLARASPPGSHQKCTVLIRASRIDPPYASARGSGSGSNHLIQIGKPRNPRACPALETIGSGTTLGGNGRFSKKSVGQVEGKCKRLGLAIAHNSPTAPGGELTIAPWAKSNLLL